MDLYIHIPVHSRLVNQFPLTKFKRVKATLLSVEFNTSKVLGEAQHLKCCFNTLNSVDISVTLLKVNS